MAGCDPSTSSPRPVRTAVNSGQVREQADRLPEYTHYQDSGCEVAPACLRCPLVRCKYDPDLAGRRDWLPRARRGQRDREIIAFYEKGRPAIRDLARHFGVSIRTAHRALAAARRDGTRAPESIYASAGGGEQSVGDTPTTPAGGTAPCTPRGDFFNELLIRDTRSGEEGR